VNNAKLKYVNLIIILIITLYTNAKGIEISDFSPEGWFADIVKVDNNIYLLAVNPSDASIKFFLKENNNWKELSNKYIENGKEQLIYSRLFPSIKADKYKNIWLGANGLYKFNGTNWERNLIEDELKEFRTFHNLVIDDDDNKWFSSVIRKNPKTGFNITESGLHKFKDGNFTTLEKNDIPNYYTKIRYVNDKIYVVCNNFTYLPYKLNLDTCFDVRIYDTKTNQIINKLRIPVSDKRDGFEFNKYPKMINDLIVDKYSNIYVSLLQYGVGDTPGSGTEIVNCCDDIVVFDSLYNYKIINEIFKEHDEELTQVKLIYKLNDEYTIFFQGTKAIFINNNYTTYSEISKKDILENAVIYKPTQSQPNEEILSLENNGFFFIQTMQDDDYLYLLNNNVMNQIPLKSFITSVDTDILNNSELIYPNPVDNYLDIKSINNIDYNLELIKIYNSTGKDLTNLINIQEKQINVSNLVAGVYYIVFSKDKSSKSFKFIKN